MQMSVSITPGGADGPLYVRVGGEEYFRRLVDAFYRRVADDPVLLPLYPEQPDLSGAKDRLTLFLMQFFGGPTTYSDTRGHPALRMRHSPYPIAEIERDAWLTHMSAAVDEVETAEVERGELLEYFHRAAHHLQNATREGSAADASEPGH